MKARKRRTHLRLSAALTLALLVALPSPGSAQRRELIPLGPDEHMYDLDSMVGRAPHAAGKKQAEREPRLPMHRILRR